jgi:hypothetical protein
MRRVLCLAIAIVAAACARANADEPKSKDDGGTVFRKPFTLKLHVDKEHFYEQKIEKVPYVHKGNVYLFQGDSFGLDVQIAEGKIQKIAYQADLSKAAVTLKFQQEVPEDGDAMMMLTIENRTKHKLFLDAVMVVPDRQKPLRTSILPVQPGLSGIETWPHPIIQLVLRNLRLTEKPSAEKPAPKKKTPAEQ